jgi:hypothetical protein
MGRPTGGGREEWSGSHSQSLPASEQESVMKQLPLGSIASLGVLLLGATSNASAQQYYTPYPFQYSQMPGLNPGGGPRLNPYLNFFRGNPAVDYYLGAVPEIDRRRFQVQTRSQISGLEQQLNTPPIGDEDMLPLQSQTGHAVAFGNTAGYFSGGFTGRVSMGSRVPATTTPTARPPR